MDQKRCEWNIQEELFKAYSYVQFTYQYGAQAEILALTAERRSQLRTEESFAHFHSLWSWVQQETEAGAGISDLYVNYTSNIKAFHRIQSENKLSERFKTNGSSLIPSTIHIPVRFSGGDSGDNGWE